MRGDDELVSFALIGVGVVLASCAGPTADGLCLRLMGSDFRFPVLLTSPPGDERIFIVRQEGLVDILGPLGSSERFLDVSDVVTFGFEQGLLGLAFHPHYTTNGTFFIYYKGLDGDMHLDRMAVSADPDRADPDSREPVLEVSHDVPAGLHNSGHILFGPDGHLWVTAGDGGASDTLDVALDTSDLRGSILRVDVEPLPGPAGYSIPADNPFADGADGARPEIYMYGLRNPWRIEIDPPTRLLYVADVGETRREELDVVPVEAAGTDFGWDGLEGTYCRLSDCTDLLESTTLPVLEYTHDEGVAIIGGHVYRGDAVEELQGRYVFGDHQGFIRSLVIEGGEAVDVREHFAVGELFLDGDNPGLITAFSRDSGGELYVLMWGGRIFRIEPEPDADPP